MFATEKEFNMPRQPRYPMAGIPQHIIQRGNNRQATFFDDADYKYYRFCLAEALRKHDCQLHAYVFMTNHVHLLVTPQYTDGMSGLMQSVGRRYVRYINDTYCRSGTLWEGRYKASPIDSARYLLTCYRYIELNPVRAGIVGSPGDYPYSSYAYHTSDTYDPLISDHDLYLHLGETTKARQEAYRSLFEGHIDAKTVEEIRGCTNACLVLGNEQFKDEVEEMLRRSVRHKKAGRPRKEIAV